MAGKQSKSAAEVSLAEVMRWLKRRGTAAQVAELERYGITAKDPFGVTVGELKAYAKELGRDHGLAADLWSTDRYEARMLACMVDEPERVSVAQMNAWAGDFDSWAIVDTACFHLFDRTRQAWGRPPVWAEARPEFKRRAAFALLWALSVHDKQASDGAFLEGLELIERGAEDERHFVKKAVNMALRAIGKRNLALNGVAVETARRLADSPDPAPSWVGRHALRELTGAALLGRLKARSK